MGPESAVASTVEATSNLFKKNPKGKGVIIGSVLIILMLLALLGYVLMSKGLLKRPTFLPKTAPKVEVKKQYKNPFNKETQYINPFNQTQNPFRNL